MRKFLFVAVGILCLRGYGAFAQNVSFVISTSVGNFPVGEEITLIDSIHKFGNNSSFMPNLGVYNGNMNSARVAIRRVILKETNSSYDQICWGNCSFPKESDYTSGSMTLPGDFTLEFETANAVHLFPHSEVGMNEYLFILNYFGIPQDTVKVIWGLVGNNTTIDQATEMPPKLYPNPVKGNYLNLKLPYSNTLYFYNIIGTLVKTLKAEKGMQTLFIGNIPKGIYFIKFDQGSAKYKTQKLVIE